MALENLNGTGKFIDSLVSTNPAGTDAKSQGDDHLRGIKNVVKNSFNFIKGAVTASHIELSYSKGLTGPIQDQLDIRSVDEVLGNVFVGETVFMPINVFNYTTTTLGKVWLKCDGSLIPNTIDNERLIRALGFGSNPTAAFTPNYTGAAAPAQPGDPYQEIIVVIKI